VANILAVIGSGAVGFIDWLGLCKHLDEEQPGRVIGGKLSVLRWLSELM